MSEVFLALLLFSSALIFVWLGGKEVGRGCAASHRNIYVSSRIFDTFVMGAGFLFAYISPRGWILIAAALFMWVFGGGMRRGYESSLVDFRLPWPPQRRT